MKKRILSLFLTVITVCSFAFVVHADSELTSETFTLYADVLSPDGDIIPSDLRFNLFTEEGEWLGNQMAAITESGSLIFRFNVPEYEIGAKFIVVPTTGATYVNYCDLEYGLNDEILVETYAYRNGSNEVVISDEAHVAVLPLFEENSWEKLAEKHVNDKKIWSDTPYLIWVSKANFKVSVFLRENGKWNCIKTIGCSIGAPGTPTVTGQFKYYQYQKKWDYGSYYVGPIMRFYGGYAIHSTLVNNNGTDRDGRIGKMISHGCVRVRPENINWLTAYIPLGTKIYITNQ